MDSVVYFLVLYIIDITQVIMVMKYEEENFSVLNACSCL